MKINNNNDKLFADLMSWPELTPNGFLCSVVNCHQICSFLKLFPGLSPLKVNEKDFNTP